MIDRSYRFLVVVFVAFNFVLISFVFVLPTLLVLSFRLGR
jgi:hypothetical protein